MTLKNRFASIRSLKNYFPITSIDEFVHFFIEFLSSHCKSKLSLEKPTREFLNTIAINSDLLKSNVESTLIEDSTQGFTNFFDSDCSVAFISILFGLVEDKLTNYAAPKSNTKSFQQSRNATHNSKVHNTTPLTVDTCLSDVPSPNSNITPTSVKTASPVISNLRSRHRRASGSSTFKNRKRHTSSLSVPEPEPSPLTDSTNFVGKRTKYDSGLHSIVSTTPSFPTISIDQIENLLNDLYKLLITHPSLQPFIDSTVKPKFANQELLIAIIEALLTRLSAHKCKDKINHAQSVYSFLVHGYVDTFGLAYTIMASANLIGYMDVCVVLSEDHAWLEFGPLGESVDISRNVFDPQLMTNKNSSIGNSPFLNSNSNIDEQNQSISLVVPIPQTSLQESWLYVTNCPIKCNSCIAAICAAVVAMQPTGPTVSNSKLTQQQILTPTHQSPASSYADDSTVINYSPATMSDWTRALTPTKKSLNTPSPLLSIKMIELKQRLLWILYTNGLLSRYPLGLTNLADLEETFPRYSSLMHEEISIYPKLEESDSPKSSTNTTDEIKISLQNKLSFYLYYQAVHVNRMHFRDSQVYPYLYLANCFYRQKDIQGAMRFWCHAARVISQYNHSNEDSEVYKELNEVATVILPHASREAQKEFNFCATGQLVKDPIDGSLYRPGNFLDDPQCLAYLIGFLDYLCVWEEDSSVPVLHVGWVDKLMSTLNRFTERARSLVRFEDNLGSDSQTSPKNRAQQANNVQTLKQVDPFACYLNSPVSNSALLEPNIPPPSSSASSSSLCSDHAVQSVLLMEKSNSSEEREKILDQLVEICQERIINPAYLCGLKPLEPIMPKEFESISDEWLDDKFRLLNSSEAPIDTYKYQSDFVDDEKTIEKIRNELIFASSSVKDEANDKPQLGLESYISTKIDESSSKVDQISEDPRLIYLHLRSQKMCGIIDLWQSKERLNISAIKLALTAQSSLVVGHQVMKMIPGSGNSGDLSPVHSLRSCCSLTNDVSSPLFSGRRQLRKKTRTGLLKA